MPPSVRRAAGPTPCPGHGREPDWEGVRLHVVTGKGGTGKTTVAAALAVALAAGGRRTLLVEVEGRQGVAQLFDVPPLPYEERRVALAPGGGEVYALAIDAEEALLEYLEMFYKMGRAGRALKKVGAIDFATTIAPGTRDVLLTGKAYEATRRRRHGGHREGPYAYDAVVMDAPPTGRIVRFLNVNSEVAGLAKVGPIRGQAESIVRLVTSPATAVHVVTLLEELPVQETADAVAELQAARLPVGGVIVNMCRPPLLTATQLSAVLKGKLDDDAAAHLGRADGQGGRGGRLADPARAGADHDPGLPVGEHGVQVEPGGVADPAPRAGAPAASDRAHPAAPCSRSCSAIV